MPDDWVIAGLVGIVLSILVLVVGQRLYRRRFELKGWLWTLMLLVGILGLIASVGWLLLGAYIDAVTR